MTDARPEVGGNSPSRILINVLLPAPLAPTSPMIPGSSSSVSPSSATTPPENRRVRSDRAIRLMGPDRLPRADSKARRVVGLAEAKAPDDLLGCRQDVLEHLTVGGFDRDHQDPVAGVDDDQARDAVRLEIERLLGRGEE